MQALLINGHVSYQYSKGELNNSFLSRAAVALSDAGFECSITQASQEYDVEAEVSKIQHADFVFFQFPLYNMGVPWVLKKYIDDVYLAGGDGRLYSGDGRSRKDPTRQYGSGGVLNRKPYFLSVTANAPAVAFDDHAQNFFGGISVSELLRPFHLACAFNDMKSLGVFTSHDVHKNPNIADDFTRFDVQFSQVVKSISI